MSSQETRQISDSRVLAAMAHPVRRRLMDVLKVHGPATASTLAERTGQAVGNASHHLRVLAAAELVEEAPELARDRRERWWRLVSAALRWSVAGVGDDPAAVAVATSAERLNLDRQVDLVRQWMAAGEAEHEAWGDGPFSTDGWLRLTPAELAEFSREVTELLQAWSRRAQEAKPDAERRPVFFFARGVPAEP